MSSDSAPNQPSPGRNADRDRVRQRQASDRGARDVQPKRGVPAHPISLHRLASRVRTALRTRRGS